MALRATGYWRCMVVRGSRAGGGGGKRSFATSTPARMKSTFESSASSSSAGHGSHQSKLKGLIKAEFAPVYMVMGMVVVAIGIGVHTAKQQLLHAPSVTFNKKKRENMAEVYDPEAAFNSADKFLTKSFLRKIAHIQDDQKTIPDPQRGDAFTSPRRAETLKSAGVESGRR